MITKEEYRKMLNDWKSPDTLIEQRLNYLKSLCRKVIKIEIEKYVKAKK
jgi:hypothetical protein